MIESAAPGAFLLIAVHAPVQPDIEHRHKRAGQQVGSNHGEPYRQRQRNKQCAGHTDHQERGNKHGQDGKHRQESGNDRLPSRFQHRQRHVIRQLQIAVNIFDLDHGLVDQDADGQGEPAQGHDVDGLIGQPQADDGGTPARTESTRSR